MHSSVALVLAVTIHFVHSRQDVATSPPQVRGGEHPVHAFEGDDVLLTCIVRSLASHAVVWKKKEMSRWRILTAAETTVTTDTRFRIIHDKGGDVWVLAIANVTHNDSGLYSCEVNSVPPAQSLHKLQIVTRDLVPPLLEETSRSPQAKAALHDYSDCCGAKNVSEPCMGFCNVQNILDGNTGTDPENCEQDFPNIVKCMAAGRNHVPCCIEEKVPDICQDVCRGEYTIITDNIKTHFSCAAYTEPTLACIVEGIELLPSEPTQVEAVAISQTELTIQWAPPYNNYEFLSDYMVNVSMLRSFDPSSLHMDQPSYNTSQSVVDPHTVQVTVKAGDNDSTYVVVRDLHPFTMYEITVTARNKHGSSLPSNAIRTLTLVPGEPTHNGPKVVPQLPDIRECCVKKGVTHSTCLDKLCDISDREETEVTDLMICAPWASTTFSCLANGRDHTPCCRARGLPDVCNDLCSGNVTQLNFNFFKCIKYMPTYRNCLMQGYGVLPGRPTKLRVTNRDVDFAIVHWSLPKERPETVINFNLHYRKYQDEEYTIVYEVKPPYILEGLESSTMYEVYVTASNIHGTGESSQRVVFSTESKIFEAKLEDAENSYNVTSCCVSAGVTSTCMPLCSYDASMSQLKVRALACASEFTKLLRCGAGGRNHSPCCSRRGVQPACLSLCSGVVTGSLTTTAATCTPFIGNIVQCFEEGTGVLPGPVSELHALKITNSEITLMWEPPTTGNITGYIVHYKKVDNTSMHETPLKLENQKNTTSTVETLNGLETGHLYNIFVVSQNENGTSLPSAILLINVSHTDLQGSTIPGVTSPPHSLGVSSHSATYVTFTWQPPEFSDPSEQLLYRVRYKSHSDGKFQMVETSVTSHTLENLSPNTQYIVYVSAVSGKGESLPSETLIAWTDPAYPAYVEPPTVHPINLVVEGSSMTILCIAMGTPMPTISLYISGRFVRQEVTRHMVTVINNVTRDMNHISCYADNGYGTPMEARRRIIISYKPHISPSGITMAAYGETITLDCQVESYPEPKMMFWRDFNLRIPVINGGKKHEAQYIRNKDDEDKWTMRLTIKSIEDNDEGEYYCHAENAFGNATQPVSIRIRNVAAASNVTQCCIERNVTSVCMDACSFYLDIDAVIDKPECIADFDKLMKCGSDGSDHRSCCVHNGVERGCLDWCRGEALFAQDHKSCLLHHTKKIMSCFREGRDRLPGPPLNVRVERIDDHSVMVHWDPPIKNPHTVEVYRVFWRQTTTNSVTLKNDSKMTSLKITGLKSAATYECSVKAGNTRGTSTLSDPVQFTTDEKYITSAASIDEETPTYGMAVGMLFSVGAVTAIVVGAIWFIRSRNMNKGNGGVAFENPSYLREVNMDHMQSNGDSGWRNEPLQVPQCTEVAPTLFEELKLGANGAGFKRLKP